MDFWRIFRLISAKRNYILVIVLITGMIVAAGTWLRSMNKEYSAEAVLQPQDPTAVQPGAVPNGTTASAPSGDPGTVRRNNISDLLMQLRSSSDIPNRAAALLKLPEAERRKEVSRILEKNGYFAQINADIESRADQAVKDGDLTAARKDAWIKTEQGKAQSALTNSLAVASDSAGAFAAGGAGTKTDEIVEHLRKIVSYESVEGPFSTDTDRQVVNQIKIIAESPRAAEAEMYANMVSVAFLDNYSNRSISSTTAQIALIKERLETARALYNKAQQASTDYKAKTPVAAFAPTTQQILSNVQNYENSLNVARQEQAGLTASVAELKTQVATASPTQTVQLPSDENPEVRALQAEVTRLTIAFNKVKSSNVDTGNEIYKQAKAELDEATAQLNRAKQRIYGNTIADPNFLQLKAQLDQAQVKLNDVSNRVQTLTAQVATERAKLASLPKAASIVADLDREVNLRQNNVDALEKALASLELESISKARTSTVNIVSPARADLIRNITPGQLVKIVIYGMLLAAVFSVLLFIALDALDNAVKTASDAQRLLDLSVIGQIPTHVSDLVRGARLVALDPLNPAAESYRLLRTDLIFQGLERSFKTLVVAPIRPAQGATTTAGNLAIALAQSGRKVILVDADLRRPKMHAIFGLSNETGLSTVLKGEADYNNALLPTDVENLTLLPAGAPVMNPSELVGSGMMGALMKRMRDMAEYVIIDSPSPATYADGAVLASMSDATLLVLRAGEAPDGAAEAQVRERLEKARANVLGMVLNDVEPERLLGSRRQPEYQPALVSGNVGTIGTTPLPALPKPGGTSARPIPTPVDGERLINGDSGASSGEVSDELPDAPLEAPSPKPQIRKPRIVSTAIPTTSGTNGTNGAGSAADKKAIRPPETPLLILLSLGLSTAVSALTIALSRAGQ